MENFCFYIDKDICKKRIAIFGASENGIKLYNQIKDICTVVIFIDNYLESSYVKIPVINVKELLNYEMNIDYILLGSASFNSQRNLISLLTDNGIEKQKIIQTKRCFSEEFMAVYKVSRIEESIYVFLQGTQKLSCTELISDDFLEFLNYYLFFLEESFVIYEKQKFLDIYNKYACSMWPVFCNTLMYKCNLYTEIEYKKFIEAIINLPDELIDWKTVLIFSSLEEVFRRPSLIYKDYYQQRYCIMDKLAKSYREEYPQNIQKLNDRTIAILAFWLPDKKTSAHGIIISNIANELIKQGYRVKVFIENHNYDCTTKGLIEANYYFPPYCEKFEKIHKSQFDESIEIYYNYGTAIRERYNNYLKEIYAYNPEIIIDMGDEISFTSHTLANDYKIYYYPIRSNLGSSFKFHRYLSSNSEISKINNVYHFTDEKKIRFLPLGTTIPKSVKKFTKEEMGINKNDFVLVTVGDRLDEEITNDLVKIVSTYLKKELNWKWILVGRVDINKHGSEMKKMVKENRILLHGYEDDLFALYQVCDIFLNPDRIGGGWSIAWAMIAGVPIATLAGDNSGTRWVGEDKAIVGGYNDVLQYISDLSHDSAYLEKERQQMKILSSKFSYKKIVEKLLDVIAEG